jgi:hypothetical protein
MVEREVSMSGQIGVQPRTLPFTGLATGPLVLLGLLLSGMGFLMTIVRPSRHKA